MGNSIPNLTLRGKVIFKITIEIPSNVYIVKYMILY